MILIIIDDINDINKAWETIRENIRISAKESIWLCESKSYKPRFDEKFLKLVDGRKQAKLQWLQDPSVVNENNNETVHQVSATVVLMPLQTTESNTIFKCLHLCASIYTQTLDPFFFLPVLLDELYFSKCLLL
jgi:hypothetical protein